MGMLQEPVALQHVARYPILGAGSKIRRVAVVRSYKVDVSGGDNMAALDMQVCLSNTSQFVQNHPRSTHRSFSSDKFG